MIISPRAELVTFKIPTFATLTICLSTTMLAGYPVQARGASSVSLRSGRLFAGWCVQFLLLFY